MNRLTYVILIVLFVNTGLFSQQPKAIEVQTGIGKTSIKVYPGVKSAEVFSPEEKRFALVIGVSDYDYQAPLPCVKNDVDTVRRVLQKAGFDVAVALDKSKNEIEAIIDESRQYCIDNGYNIITFYYSGHGAQFNNIQMLISKELTFTTADTSVSKKLKRIMDNSILLPSVIDKLNIPNAKAVLGIVDACRDEAYLVQQKNIGEIPTDVIIKLSNIQRNLEGKANVGILYSSLNGETSATAPVVSLFTQYFLRALSNKPGNFGDLAIRISKEMKDKGEKQKPVNTNNPIDYDFKFFRTINPPLVPSDTGNVGWFKNIKTFEMGGYVNSIAFSPDGTTALLGLGDATLKLLDIATGECLRTFNGHRSDVLSVAISPDGKTAISGAYEIDFDALKLWDLASGSCLKTFAGHGEDKNVYCVAFSPDGKKVLSGGSDNTLKLWDIATGKCVMTFKGHAEKNIEGTLLQLNSVKSVAFSPDGNKVLSGASDGTLKLWNIATGQCVTTFTGHKYGVNSVAFSQDGKTLLSGSSDGTIKIWWIGTGQCVKTFTGHKDAVNSVAFSPDRKTVLSGSEDRTIKIWDIATGNCLETYTEHNGTVNSVAFSPDGKTALSGSADHTLKLWDIAK